MTKENLAVGAFIAVCFGSVATGITMWVMTDNSWWLWLCVPIVLFLS